MASLRSRGAGSRGLACSGALALAAFLCVACNDPVKKQAQAEARLRAEKAREAAEQQARLAQEAAAVARRRAEEDAAREREAAQKKQLEHALAACCQALGRRAFEERSMPDMTAKQACLELEQKQVSLGDARSALTSALGERALPAACSAP